MTFAHRMLAWLGLAKVGNRTTCRRVFVSLHRGGLKEAPEVANLVALGLHEALTERRVACALVDIDEWILRAALDEGKFRLMEESEAEEVDDLTGEPAWERERRADIGWLLANRSRLVRDAMRSGGDAEVIVLLHSLEFMELTGLWGIKGRDDEVLLFYLGENQPGLPGYLCAPMSERKAGKGFVFGDNAADDAVTWRKLARRVAKGLR